MYPLGKYGFPSDTGNGNGKQQAFENDPIPHRGAKERNGVTYKKIIGERKEQDGEHGRAGQDPDVFVRPYK